MTPKEWAKLMEYARKIARESVTRTKVGAIARGGQQGGWQWLILCKDWESCHICSRRRTNVQA